MAELHEPLARRATELLLAVAAGDESAANDYDALLFAFLKDTALRRGRFMSADAAERAGVQAARAGGVRSADLEEVAVVAAQLALRRARGSALRFDPGRGDGASWALGALAHAYGDARRLVTGTRRVASEVPTAAEAFDRESLSAVDPAVRAEVMDALDRALRLLSEHERFAILAVAHYGMSYREIAAHLFGNEGETKAVDQILQSARRKLQTAQDEWARDQ